MTNKFLLSLNRLKAGFSIRHYPGIRQLFEPGCLTHLGSTLALLGELDSSTTAEQGP